MIDDVYDDDGDIIDMYDDSKKMMMIWWGWWQTNNNFVPSIDIRIGFGRIVENKHVLLLLLLLVLLLRAIDLEGIIVLVGREFVLEGSRMRKGTVTRKNIWLMVIVAILWIVNYENNNGTERQFYIS
jgi:hypothetical protein